MCNFIKDSQQIQNLFNIDIIRVECTAWCFENEKKCYSTFIYVWFLYTILKVIAKSNTHYHNTHQYYSTSFI